MHSKISSKWALLIIGIVGIGFCSIIIFFLAFDLPGQDSYAESASHTSGQTLQNIVSGKPAQSIPGSAVGEHSNSVLSIRLKIPKINVNGAIESVGVTADGEMDVPKGPTNVAWFNLGPRPGETGSSVIDGHFGWYNGVPAVFNNLYKLQQGDKLYVEDETGVTTTFVVRESRSYDPKADASEVFSSDDGKAHLNLITCEGVWNKTQKSYSNRLVVFADKEME